MICKLIYKKCNRCRKIKHALISLMHLQLINALHQLFGIVLFKMWAISDRIITYRIVTLYPFDCFLFSSKLVTCLTYFQHSVFGAENRSAYIQRNSAVMFESSLDLHC